MAENKEKERSMLENAIDYFFPARRSLRKAAEDITKPAVPTPPKDQSFDQLKAMVQAQEEYKRKQKLLPKEDPGKKALGRK